MAAHALHGAAVPVGRVLVQCGVTFWVCGWSLLTYPLWFWVFPRYLGQDGIQLYGDETHHVYVDNPFEITVTVLLGLLITLATPWIVRGLTTVDRLLVHGLLGPSRLATRVVELESDRGVVVDTAAADLRRIERDLHDGAQARLWRWPWTWGWRRRS